MQAQGPVTLVVSRRASSRLALVPLALSLGALASACTPSTSEQNIKATRTDLLGSLGFALTDDGDPLTSAGDLTASFDAPVVDIDGSLAAYGTAHLAFDDEERDLESVAVLGAVTDADIVYAMLFDEEVPWRWAIVAAHAADLVPGASLALDGVAAAAIVVDEETGSGYLTTSGTFDVTDVALQDGGHLRGALSGALAEVTLDAWPQALFPFTGDGSEATEVLGSASGTFAAVWSERGDAIGAANVTFAADGFSPFTADQASAFPLDDLSTAIVLASSVDAARIAVLVADTASLAAGASLAFDGFSTGAWLLESDGSQIAFSAGTLALDGVQLVVDGIVSGSVSIDGTAYVLPPEDFPSEGEGEGEGEDCTGIETVAQTFEATSVYLDSGFGPEEMPAGYDRVLTFTNNDVAMFGLILADTVDFSVATPWAFDVVDFDGRAWPAGVLGLATCSQLIDVDSGVLDAAIVDGRMTGTLSYTSAGQSRTIDLDVEVLQ